MKLDPFYRISYSYTPIEGINGCIYDVECLTDEEVAALDLDEPSELQDTTSGTFSYGDVVTYRCPRAKEFRLQDDSLASSVEYRCQWNGTWSGGPSAHPQCDCKRDVQRMIIEKQKSRLVDDQRSEWNGWVSVIHAIMRIIPRFLAPQY